MRLTPLDIQQRSFARAFRGYDENDVNEFINRIAKDYEQMFTENRSLTEQVQRLKDQMRDYIELEKTLKQTLVSAQKSSEEVRVNAEKESELIIKEAELKAEKIIEDARAEVRALLKEIQILKKQKRMFKLEMKNLLDAYQELAKDDGDMGPGSRVLKEDSEEEKMAA